MFVALPPPPKGQLCVSATTATSVYIQWTPLLDPSITGYCVEYGEGPNYSMNDVKTVSPWINNYTIDKLHRDKEYLFQVSSVNSAGKSKPNISERFTCPASSPRGKEMESCHSRFVRTRRYLALMIPIGGVPIFVYLARPTKEEMNGEKEMNGEERIRLVERTPQQV